MRTYGDVDLAEHGDAFEGVFEGDVLGRGDDDGACVGGWMVTLALSFFPGAMGWFGRAWVFYLWWEEKGSGGSRESAPMTRRDEVVNENGSCKRGKGSRTVHNDLLRNRQLRVPRSRR